MDLDAGVLTVVETIIGQEVCVGQIGSGQRQVTQSNQFGFRAHIAPDADLVQTADEPDSRTGGITEVQRSIRTQNMALETFLVTIRVAAARHVSDQSDDAVHGVFRQSDGHVHPLVNRQCRFRQRDRVGRTSFSKIGKLQPLSGCHLNRVLSHTAVSSGHLGDDVARDRVVRNLDPRLNAHVTGNDRSVGDTGKISGRIKLERAVDQRAQAVQGIRALRGLDPVLNAIVIGIGIARMRAVGLLELVTDAVRIGVGVSRLRNLGIAAREELIEIRHTVRVEVGEAKGRGIRSGGSEVAEVLDFPLILNAVVIRIDLCQSAVVLDKGGRTGEGTVEIPVIASSEVLNRVSTIVERVVGNEAAFGAIHNQIPVRGNRGEAPRRIPDPDLVKPAVEGRATDGQRTVVAGLEALQGDGCVLSAVGLVVAVDIRRVDNQNQRSRVGANSCDVAPLVSTDACVRPQRNNLVADREDDVTVCIVGQLVVDVAAAGLGQDDRVRNQSRVRPDPGLDREHAGQIQLLLRRVNSHSDDVTRVKIHNPQLERAAAVSRITDAVGYRRRGAVVRASGFLAIVQPVVVSVRDLRVGAIGLLVDIAEPVVVGVAAQFQRTGARHVRCARVPAEQELVEVGHRVAVGIARGGGGCDVTEVHKLPEVRDTVGVSICVEIGEGVVRFLVAGQDRHEVGRGAGVVGVVGQGCRIIEAVCRELLGGSAAQVVETVV